MALDMSSFDAALKQYYTTDMIENMVYKDNPLLALMPKMEDFRGRNLPIVLIYANPQGTSGTFLNAQTRGAVTNSRVQDFVLTRVHHYSIATIDNEVLEASKGNAGAFMEAATLEIDGCINSLTRALATGGFRSGWGDIGIIGATTTVSTATLTLADPASVVNFEVGMDIVFAATQASSVLRGSGASLQIIAVDRSNGILTMSGALNSVSGVAVGDYVFVNGNRANSATPIALMPSGLEAWIPATAPTSTPFFGVDRSVDTSRLGGQRMDGTSKPIEEALIDGASLVAREGGKLSHYFMSYEKYSMLEKSLGSKVQYIDLKVDTTDVGFRGIQINGPRGPIQVIPDQNCPSNRIFGLALDTWKLYSLGKAVRVIEADGLQMLRQATADGVEVRYGFYGNIGCRAPGFNINIQV